MLRTLLLVMRFGCFGVFSDGVKFEVLAARYVEAAAAIVIKSREKGFDRKVCTAGSAFLDPKEERERERCRETDMVEQTRGEFI